MREESFVGQKEEIDNNTSIPQREIEIIARCIFPDILAFYESEEGQREFAEQNGKRNRQKSQIKKLQHKPLTKYRNRQVNPPDLGIALPVFYLSAFFFRDPRGLDSGRFITPFGKYVFSYLSK